MHHRTLPLLASALLASTMLAQPVLTHALNAPLPGATYTMHYGAYVSPGGAGAGQTWNLSGLSADSTATLQLVAPTSTPFNTSFPNATVAETGGAGVMFFRTTPNGVYFAGSASEGIVIPYTEQGRYLTFPCTFGTQWTDTESAAFTADGFSVERTGTITGHADGSGTLVLPDGQVTNVLRVHWHEEAVDTTAGFAMHSVHDSHLYYVPGIAYPLAQLVHRELSFLGTTQVTEYAQWVGDLSTDITDDGETEGGLRLFPVPAHDRLIITSAHGHLEPGSITVLDMAGRQVGVQQVRCLQDGRSEIALNDLRPGTYLLQLTNAAGHRSSTRFVVN